MFKLKMVKLKTVKSLLPALLSLSLLSFPAWATSPPVWQTETVTETVAKLPKGSTVKTYVSPDKKRQLILRDEGNHGDFFYYAYYFFDGKKYHHIQTYVARGKEPVVSWKKDFLSFEAATPIGPEQIQVMTVEYYYAKKQLRYKVLKTEAMQHTG